MPLSPITPEPVDYNVTIAGDERRQRAGDVVSASGPHMKITSMLVLSSSVSGRRLRDESGEPPEMEDMQDKRPAKRSKLFAAHDDEELMFGIEQAPSVPQSIAAVAAVTTPTASTFSSPSTSHNPLNNPSAGHFLSRSSSTASLAGSANNASGSSSSTGSGLGHASHAFFFESGDLTLNVENYLFRIHSEKLANVCGFYNMLSPKQPGQRLTYQEIVGTLGPDCQSQVDGTPLLRLDNDKAKDWLVALEAIYEPMTFQVRPIVFDTLASALKISTKYYIQFLRDWAIAQMRTTWPSNLDQMVPMALPHAAEAISLARECRVPEILPAAFYALSIQKWRTNADGNRAHNVLSPDDLRRLVMGREALQDLLVEIVAAPLSVPSPPPPRPGTSGSNKGVAVASADANAEFAMEKFQSVMPAQSPAHPAFVFCPSPAPCRARLELLWRNRLAPDATRPWNTWTLRELHRMATLPLSSLDENMENNYMPSSASSTLPASEMVDEAGNATAPTAAPIPEPLVCKKCWEENRRLAVWRLNFLRDAIPKWFHL